VPRSLAHRPASQIIASIEKHQGGKVQGGREPLARSIEPLSCGTDLPRIALVSIFAGRFPKNSQRPKRETHCRDTPKTQAPKLLFKNKWGKLKRCISETHLRQMPSKSLKILVGARGFEPPTPSPPDWCANQAALRSDPPLLPALGLKVNDHRTGVTTGTHRGLIC
jgi:hypothetical protein